MVWLSPPRSGHDEIIGARTAKDISQPGGPFDHGYVLAVPFDQLGDIGLRR
jgi:hypothetical protein